MPPFRLFLAAGLLPVLLFSVAAGKKGTKPAPAKPPPSKAAPAKEPAAPSKPDDEEPPAKPEMKEMSVLARTTRVIDFTHTPPGVTKGAERRIRATIRSEIENFQKEFVCKPISPNSIGYTDETDALGFMMLGGGDGAIFVEVIFATLGEKSGMDLYEWPKGSGKYQSLYPLLVAKFDKAPTAREADAMTASLASNVSDAKEDGVRLTETGPDTGIFRNADDSFVVRIRRFAPRGPERRDDFTALVTSKALGIEKEPVDAIESGPDSREFRTDALYAWKHENDPKAKGTETKTPPDAATPPAGKKPPAPGDPADKKPPTKKKKKSGG